MKNSKILTSLIMILTLIFSLSSLSFAKTIKDLDKVDKKLIKLGLTEDEIATMHPELKMEIAKDAVKLISKKTVRQKMDDSKNDDGVSILSNSDSYLTIDTYSLLLTKDGSYQRWKIVASWGWSGPNPAVTLTDKLGIAWSDSWTEVAHDARYYYTSPSGPVTVRPLYTDSAAKVGAGWDIDLAFSGVGHNGWSSVTLEKPASSHGTTQHIMKYYHQKFTPGGSLSFSSTPSIGISMSYNYSSLADSDWFDY